MSTTIALIGRANVGKSTLFNLLCQDKKAIVANVPGTTRDRQYGMVRRYVKNNFNIIDTGGITKSNKIIEKQTQLQVDIALNEAEIIFFMVDAKNGLVLEDQIIAEKLRKLKEKKDIYLLVNKSDGLNLNYAALDFFQLALAEPTPISAFSRLGVKALMSRIDHSYANSKPDNYESQTIKIAIIGKPNVGKSTLINRLVGENRLITSSEAGTSRDSIEVPLEYDKQKYSLIDTAGIRRRSKIAEALERLTVIKAMQSMQIADVVVFVVDANEMASSQDLRLIELALESKKALLVVINKCDQLNRLKMKDLKENLLYKMSFLNWVEIRFVSAIKGFGLNRVLNKVKILHQKACSDLSTNELTKTLHRLNEMHQSPKVKNKRIKFRYAHQGGKNPLIIVLHGNHDQAIPQNYNNYLTSGFRKQLNLTGVPISLQFRKSENPYKDNKNQLNERQKNKRKRMLRFVKAKH